MGSTETKNLTKEKMNLEIQLIINRRLYERSVIDTATYQAAMNEILKSIQMIKSAERTN